MEFFKELGYITRAFIILGVFALIIFGLFAAAGMITHLSAGIVGGW